MRSIRTRLARIYSWLAGTRCCIRGSENSINLGDAIMRECRIEVSGKNNRIIFAPGCRFWGTTIILKGDNLSLIVGESCGIRRSRWVIEDSGSGIKIGSSTTMTEATFFTAEGSSIIMGDDCMCSKGSDFRSSDAHTISDSQTGKRLNLAQNITIGDHVWISMDVQIAKGAMIQNGSIIGMRSLVTGIIPANCVAFGVPATVRRENIQWHRTRGEGVIINPPISAEKCASSETPL